LRLGTVRWLAAIGLLAVALAALVIFPGADLVVSGWFYRPDGGFTLARLPLFLFLMKAISDLSVVVTVVALLLGLWARFKGRVWLGVTPRIAAFLAASLIIGPGLIVNTLFKDNWGRARPHQILEFGGTAHFTPAVLPADQCYRNCSFPSGHGALAMWLIAFAMVAPPRWRTPAMVATIIVGILISAMRIVQGGHFLSDTVASALIVVAVNLILYRLIFMRPAA
jgi:lipid A 4'-phosphatase